MDQENPTPQAEAGGASITDRLEQYLAAQDAPDQTQADTAQAQPADGAAKPEPVEPDDDGQQSDEPQITTSDLAKFLGVDETALDLDEDGSVKLKTKVDGQEGTAKLQDLLKSYQLQEHVDRKAREAADKEKAIHARVQEVEQAAQARLQQVEALANVAAQELMRDFQSIDWQTLRQNDPGEYAARQADFQARNSQLQGVFQTLAQNKAQSDQQAQAQRQQMLAQESQRLPVLIPEWKDEAVATRERGEIREWAIKAGIPQEDVANVANATYIAVMRKAMLFDKLQQSRPAVENKVRTAPKLVKPGQAPQDTKQQSLRNLKQSVQKSGGKADRVAEYLMATGRA